MSCNCIKEIDHTCLTCEIKYNYDNLSDKKKRIVRAYQKMLKIENVNIVDYSVILKLMDENNICFILDVPNFNLTQSVG